MWWSAFRRSRSSCARRFCFSCSAFFFLSHSCRRMYSSSFSLGLNPMVSSSKGISFSHRALLPPIAPDDASNGFPGIITERNRGGSRGGTRPSGYASGGRSEPQQQGGRKRQPPLFTERYLYCRTPVPLLACQYHASVVEVEIPSRRVHHVGPRDFRVRRPGVRARGLIHPTDKSVGEDNLDDSGVNGPCECGSSFTGSGPRPVGTENPCVAVLIHISPWKKGAVEREGARSGPLPGHDAGSSGSTVDQYPSRYERLFEKHHRDRLPGTIVQDCFPGRADAPCPGDVFARTRRV